MAATHPVVEYMTTTSIGEKGQLTVPKEFRDDLRLKAGAPVVILRMGNGLLLIPEQERFERLCTQVSNALESAGITAVSALEPLPKIRRQVYAERYGKIESEKRVSRRPGRGSTK